MMSRIYTHAFFICAVLVAGFIIGMTNMPGEWYESLAKPSFNPPNWLFAPAWSLLYVLIGWVGARLFLRRQDRAVLFWLWIVLLVMNFSWSPVFFGLHFTFAAFLIILFMFIGIIAFIALAWHRERFSAILFMPYVLWVGFAMVLNGAIVYLN
ncbi:TspO/MBR family protein [Martelella mediterranea]|uniref:TspO/MBR related protein n=1 Tax=Martelella mediterranea TaxID=293089 RepID=A0A4R3NW83_9HYPH|nr:TspO/MBR related protein [Martelella mediterranea]